MTNGGIGVGRNWYALYYLNCCEDSVWEILAETGGHATQQRPDHRVHDQKSAFGVCLMFHKVCAF
jgi:hypothetical protein